MLKSRLSCGTLVLLCLLDSLAVSELSRELTETAGRKLVKRHNDYQACLDNFDIHTDKIIRTQDSREMGAKYIKERDVMSRDECLRLCCDTDNCDVFVFEEKAPGSCYLFECGTPEDFKCKFTKHKNYTSAVLAINRHLTELETQIKFTQHEHELTNLREPGAQDEVKSHHHHEEEEVLLPTGVPGVKSQEEKQLEVGKCSQYQFKCHTSGECIGIYNACDGIAQCADASDEAPQLGCPTTPTSVVAVTTLLPKVEPKVDHKIVEQQRKESQVVNPQQAYVPEGGVLNNYGQSGTGVGGPPVGSPYYGREGEAMLAHRPPEQWPNPHPYHQAPSGGSQIFAHKGNGIVPQQKADWYYPRPYVSPEMAQQPVMPQYGDQVANYYDNSMAYRMSPQWQSLNNWPGPHKTQGEVAGGGEETGVRLPVVGGEDYYEEMYRSRGGYNAAGGQQQQQQQPMVGGGRLSGRPPAAAEGRASHGETPIDMSNHGNAGEEHDVPKKRPPLHPPPPPPPPPPPGDSRHLTTLKPNGGHASHRKVDKVTADVKVKELLSDEEIDGHNTSPSGAVLSLTMGLLITAILLIFIGCRMRVVGRRMRRGGKSPYAHDADFLVNGMYL